MLPSCKTFEKPCKKEIERYFRGDNLQRRITYVTRAAKIRGDNNNVLFTAITVKCLSRHDFLQ